MLNNQSKQKVDKLFTLQTLCLCIVGLLINMILANLVKIFSLPLYIDNVGSVFIAALGGAIPGMTVGFLSNLINSSSDPISMYYAILTIVNALVAAWLSRKGYLRKIWGCLILACAMMLIGGACGSVMTWFLYGGGIGGIAAPIATFFFENGIPEFWAQFLADMCIDVPDKLLTVLPVYFFLHFYPKKLYDVFPNSFLYERSGEEVSQTPKENEHERKRTSVNVRITGLIVISAIVVSGIATTVSIIYYQQELRNEYKSYVTSTAKLIAASIDGNSIDAYIKNGVHVKGYLETKNQLVKIQNSLTDINYIYAFRAVDEGCQVIYDLDTYAQKGSPSGEIYPFSESLGEHKQEIFDGKPVEGMVVKDEAGWSITSCEPITDAGGNVVAYSGADMSMDHYVQSMLAFIIRMLSILFGFSLFISSIALWYARMRFTSPINAIVEQTRKFAQTPPEEWLTSEAWENRVMIQSNDEIEELCETINEAQKNISENAIKLEQMDKETAMKSEFYARMSHDMRTPMNGILGLVHLSRDEQDINVLKDNLEKVGMSGKYLLALINDTLDMSKIESQKMQLECKAVCLRTIYEDIRNMMMETLRDKGIHYVRNINIKNPDAYLWVDDVRVKQIFINLFSNAVKFTPRGGTITFSVQSIESESQNNYHVEIQDTGCGMSEEFIREKLFHPFEQEKNNITLSSAGSGLGLSIVKNLVNMMEGSIRAESELGKGTTFVLDLGFPIVNAPEKKEKRIEDDTILEGKKVLICEDHPLNAEIMKRLLSKKGILFDYAENGKIGVQMFEDSEPQEYMAILMDVRMPVMDGIEATKVIRGLERVDAREIPIIAMTANAYSEDKRMTKEAGMNQHLSKPIEPKVLWKTLREYV